MSDVEIQSGQAGPGLTQMQRVTNTFVAPSKTFEDIRKGNKSWWLPFLIMILAGYIFFAAVYSKIGMTTVSENQIKFSPKAEERMAQLTPEQREAQTKVSATVTEVVFAINPLFVLGGIALMSLVLLGTINFLFGGKATFGGIFSVWMFASLPSVIKTLLGILVIYLGAPAEQFNIKNFAPTNLAAFLYPNAADANQALYSLFSSLDIITIWTLVLLAIGTATVAQVKRGSGYLAVFGWWVILVLGGAGIAAAFS